MSDDDSGEDEPVYGTIIEYRSIDKESRDVRVFGSWDRYKADTELEYQGRQIYTVIALLPAGIHQCRFLINGKIWDTNFFCDHVVTNGIKYNLIEVVPTNKHNTNYHKQQLHNKYERLIQLNPQKWNRYISLSKQMHNFFHDNTVPHLQKPFLFIRSIQMMLFDVIIPQSIIVLCFRFWKDTMQSDIHVYCRIRPMLAFELEKGCTSPIEISEDKLLIEDMKPKKYEFNYFHKLYPSQTTQQELTEDIECHLDDVLNGRNASIFVYGQTGAGKTHTMEGTTEKPGILTNSLKFIFNKINQKTNLQYVVKCAIFVIHNQRICNLVVSNDHKTKKKKKKKKEIRPLHLPNGQIMMKGLPWFTIKSVEEFQIFMKSATNKRRGMATNNCYTPRLHMCYLFEIVGVDLMNDITYIGKLNCIHLAGSERLKNKIHMTGLTLREAANINKSLSALGDVLQSLQTGNKFIPYRNSTLTDILSNSIGGHANVMVYLNICPAASNSFETVSTLKFGRRISNQQIWQQKKKPKTEK